MKLLVCVPLIVTPILTFGDGVALAQTKYRILPEDFNANKVQQMIRDFLHEQVHDALDRRLQHFESALASAEHIAEYQGQRGEFLHEI